MTIAQIARRFVKSDWGGTETAILETSKRLLAQGHRTEILCPNALADRNQEIVGGVQVRRMPYFYPYWGLRAQARQQMDRKGGNMFSFALMEALKKYPDLDLIHIHTGKRIGGIGRYFAGKRGIPYVVSLHGGVFDVPTQEAESWTAPARGAIEWGKVLGWWIGSRRVLDDASVIICVGREEQRQVQGRFPHKRVVHLPNGVDVARFAHGDGMRFRNGCGISPQARLVLAIGRIDPQKNQLFAVQMLPRLIEIEPRVHLALIGHVTSEPYHDRIVREVKNLGLSSRVTIIRGLDADGQDLVDAYHGADIFLLPSIHEPFGIAILEAWAAGLPVIASRVGGVPSFVADGRDGMLFDAGDAGAFCQVFEGVLKGKELRQALAHAGREKARKSYTWDRIAKELESLYEDALHGHSVC